MEKNAAIPRNRDFIDFLVYPNVTMLTPTRKPGRNFFQHDFFEGTYPYLTAKRSCGYLSPVPRYGPPNFANFGGLAPQNFWRNGTPCFLPIRKANGSAVCVQNFSCRLDTAPEIWGIIFDHPQKRPFLDEITTLTPRCVLNY